MRTAAAVVHDKNFLSGQCKKTLYERTCTRFRYSERQPFGSSETGNSKATTITPHHSRKVQVKSTREGGPPSAHSPRVSRSALSSCGWRAAGWTSSPPSAGTRPRCTPGGGCCSFPPGNPEKKRGVFFASRAKRRRREEVARAEW